VINIKIENKFLFEGSWEDVFFSGMDTYQQETMAETGRLILAERYKDPPNDDFIQALFMVCRKIIIKGMLEFDLERVSALYVEFKNSDFYKEREKSQTHDGRLWFECEMIEMFSESVREEKIRK
jgi:hypothetical protein